MSLNKDVINTALNGKYSEFSDAIKQELKTKMSSHDVSKNYCSEYDKIQNMKELFSKISNSGE